MKIILSADRTCDLTEELRETYGVEMIPYHISLEGKDYTDNVDITPEDLYQAFWDRKALPKTSAINVFEYKKYFEQWTSQGYAVIHFCLGSVLTSSYQNCCIAAEELENVYVIDSCNLSSAIGLQILDCRKKIEEGMTPEEIYEYFSNNQQKYHGSFVIDTYEFLKAGGRCSSIAAFSANLLNIKVSIEVDNTSGGMNVGKKYRGKQEKVLTQYVKDKLAQYPDIVRDKIFITHSGIDEKCIELVRKTIEEAMEFEHIYVTKASCTISSHCGPGTLGILFATEESRK
ncbi:MAG: DegV family protein [Roseburia sp.]